MVPGLLTIPAGGGNVFILCCSAAVRELPFPSLMRPQQYQVPSLSKGGHLGPHCPESQHQRYDVMMNLILTLLSYPFSSSTRSIPWTLDAIDVVLAQLECASPKLSQRWSIYPSLSSRFRLGRGSHDLLENDSILLSLLSSKGLFRSRFGGDAFSMRYGHLFMTE
jgi:hypothetical protein